MDAIGTNRGVPAAARLPPQQSAGRTGMNCDKSPSLDFSNLSSASGSRI